MAFRFRIPGEQSVHRGEEGQKAICRAFVMRRRSRFFPPDTFARHWTLAIRDHWRCYTTAGISYACFTGGILITTHAKSCSRSAMSWFALVEEECGSARPETIASP